MDTRKAARRESSGHQGATIRELDFLGQRFPWCETYMLGARGHCVNQETHMIGKLFPF